MTTPIDPPARLRAVRPSTAVESQRDRVLTDAADAYSRAIAILGAVDLTVDGHAAVVLHAVELASAASRRLLTMLGATS